MREQRGKMMMNPATRLPKIHCPVHGESDARVVCQHLHDETGLRLYARRLRPGHPVLVAWCERCQPVLEQEDGWTERAIAFAGLRGICTPCYEHMAGKHQRVGAQDESKARRVRRERKKRRRKARRWRRISR